MGGGKAGKPTASKLSPSDEKELRDELKRLEAEEKRIEELADEQREAADTAMSNMSYFNDKATQARGLLELQTKEAAYQRQHAADSRNAVSTRQKKLETEKDPRKAEDLRDEIRTYEREAERAENTAYIVDLRVRAAEDEYKKWTDESDKYMREFGTAELKTIELDKQAEAIETQIEGVKDKLGIPLAQSDDPEATDGEVVAAAAVPDNGLGSDPAALDDFVEDDSVVADSDAADVNDVASVASGTDITASAEPAPIDEPLIADAAADQPESELSIAEPAPEPSETSLLETVPPVDHPTEPDLGFGTDAQLVEEPQGPNADQLDAVEA